MSLADDIAKAKAELEVFQRDADALKRAAVEPYRSVGVSLPESRVSLPVGLIRANGSACTCKPPGTLWCWWYHVRAGDSWRCKHGGLWLRESSGGYYNARLHWRANSGPGVLS